MPTNAATWSAALTGPAFQAWQQSINAQQAPGDLLSAAAVTLPPNLGIGALAGYVGAPAARYSASNYVALANSGAIDTSAPTITSADNQYVYVLAPASVIGSAPHTMTTFESLQNDVFTAGDEAAGALGLPTLADVESFLTDAGKQIVMGLLVTGAIAYFLKRRKR
jgi:hypothetical protein